MTRRQAAGKPAAIHILILGDIGLSGQGLAGQRTLLPHSSCLTYVSAHYLFHCFVLQLLPARKLVSPLCGLGWMEGGVQCNSRGTSGNLHCVGNCWLQGIRGHLPSTVGLGPRLLWFIFLRLMRGQK